MKLERGLKDLRFPCCERRQRVKNLLSPKAVAPMLKRETSTDTVSGAFLFCFLGIYEDMYVHH